MSAYDRHLEGYRISSTEVWCAKTDCPNHEGMIVGLFSENGIAWTEPEECPSCGGVWLEDRPEPVVPPDPELSDEENAL